ncbi:MAG: Ig-like domain-containing protein [Bacteroidales bacterium]|nr:Ig-like domain-containing protein [Bacteroidales bacterium]
MRKLFGTFLAAAVVIILAGMSMGCDKKEPTPSGGNDGGTQTVAVTGVSLSKTSLSLVEDGSETLTATITPSNATNKALSWKSSDASIASVDGSGKVTAVKAGSATITVSTTDGGKTASCSVTVTEQTKIVIAGNTAKVPVAGGAAEFAIQYNTSYKVEIEESAQDWLHFVETRAMQSGTLVFSVDANKGEARTGKATVKDNEGKVEPITLTFEQEAYDFERAALIAIYKATGGSNWERRDNWCSDMPIDQWYGVQTNNKGRVDILELRGNITGQIPPEIGDLTELTWLSIFNSLLPDNSDYGPLPSEIGNLKKLKALVLQNYPLSGKIPESLYDLTNLQQLIIERPGHMDEQQISPSIRNLHNLQRCILRNMNLTGNLTPEFGHLFNLTELSLQGNNLSGAIPSEWGGLVNLGDCELFGNKLSGPLPQSLRLLPNYSKIWGKMVAVNNFSEEDLLASDIPAPSSPLIKTLSGSMLDIDEEFKKNKYTVLFSLDPEDGVASETVAMLKKLHDRSKPGDLGIVTYFDNSSAPGAERDKRDAAFKKLLSSIGATWPSFIYHYNDESTDERPFYAKPYNFCSQTGINNEIYIIGPAKGVEYASFLTGSYNTIREMEATVDWLTNKLDVAITHYESTDYSEDGLVTKLRSATTGQGIDIVITGDAFSDRLIAAGTFSNMADRAVSDLFSVEPLKSLADRFNVYLVNAVSQNEEYYNGGNTVFSGEYGLGAAVGGENEKVLQYARKAISDERMDNALVLVMMNSLRDCGTCYMLNPEDNSIYAGGTSIAWVPFGLAPGVTSKANLLIHEIGGHGIGKLADEYYYLDNGTISSETIEAVKEKQKNNWYLNVDFTSSTSNVLWSRFVKDSRYANENIGAYAGGYTYPTGVWRPTMWSIMNQHHVYGTFNAPSRAQIYTRIMKLSEGQDWQFDYETFVKWDQAHPTKQLVSPLTRTNHVEVDEAENEICVPPVIINKTWRQMILK